MTNEKPQLQTVTGQLFESKGEVILWLGILLVLVIGLIGTFWDLSDANILGTEQGLDAGTAGLMVVVALAVGAFFLSNVLFGREMRTKRGLAPLNPNAGRLVWVALVVAIIAAGVYFLVKG